jgi:hypothetical protein
MSGAKIHINRAPVLTLWGAVVAGRLGYSKDTALTLGKALAGLNAQTKGRRLGIFKAPKLKPGEKARKAGLGEEFWVELCGRPIPAKKTRDGVRAVVRDQPIDPAGVEDYLGQKFGEHLKVARQAMERLARSFDRDELAADAFRLYEEFRPAASAGKGGWRQKGELDLELIRKLASRPKRASANPPPVICGITNASQSPK